MDAESTETPAKEARTPARDRIFAVDRRVWANACDLGMPAAVSYLVLACRIGRPRAKRAVQALCDAGLVQVQKGGTRPRYFLVPGHDIAAAALTLEEESVLAALRAGRRFVPKTIRYDSIWGCGSPYKVACELVRKGLVRECGGQEFEAAETSDEPEWIWLPSSLVESEDGSATPVERIRQSQNVRALRLFIDLYTRTISGTGTALTGVGLMG
jgi:hypothetical protein